MEQKDYYEKLKKIEYYMQNNELTDKGIKSYITCLLYTGNLKRAYDYINITKKKNPSLYDKIELVILYIKCLHIDEAEEILNETVFSSEQYFYIAKAYLKTGEYKKAYDYFSLSSYYGLSSYYKSECNDYLKKLRDHDVEGFFLSMDYVYFKEKYELCPGDIIYAKDVNYKRKDQDSKHKIRPYMIWKIIGDKMYCFPVTTKIKTNEFGEKYDYVLYSQKYRNFDSDRALKHNLVTINERDVDKVKERIRKEDFDILLDSIYRSIIICEDNSFKKEVKMFVDSYKASMDIKLNNVISIHRGDESSNRYFFVIKVDSDGYRCVELLYENHNFSLKNENVVKIKHKANIFKKIALSEDEIDLLTSEYNKLNILNEKDAIEYEGRRYMILNVIDNKIECAPLESYVYGFSYNKIIIINDPLKIKKVDDKVMEDIQKKLLRLKKKK